MLLQSRSFHCLQRKSNVSEHQAGIFDRSFTEHLFLEFALGGGHSVEAVRAALREALAVAGERTCLLYTSPSPRDS